MHFDYEKKQKHTPLFPTLFKIPDKYPYSAYVA